MPIAKPLRNEESRLKVYALLAEGKAQAKIVEITGIDKGQVSRTAAELEASGYIKRIPKTYRPILYEKGPKAGELDALIVDRKLTSYATGVTDVAKKYARVNTAKVHHLKYRAKVLREGDMQFLRQYFDRRNVKRYKGQIAYYEHWISVEYEVTPYQQTFYVYPPEMDLIAEELGDYEAKACAITQDILNGIAKKAGWKFGLPEKTEWETHIAVEHPALVGGIAGRYYMESQDGTAFLSNSEGRDELEFKSQGGNADKAIKQAKIMLELPGQVIEISTKLSELESTLEQLVRILTLQTTGLEKVAEINGLLVQLEAKDALSKVQVASTEAARASMESRPDIGGMYQ
jgi:DNA-binding MarR family transcriptional regulator